MSRTNDRVAEALSEYADLLAITGGHAYRVRNYEKAARSVAGYHLDVAGLDEKGLDDIPAVGSSIAAKIRQIVDRGSFDELDERRSQYAGSLRRMRDTVGDLDLLVASDDPAPIMAAFCAMPLVAETLAHGTTRASVLTTKGIQVDLRVIPPDVWGAALQYFTCSKAHNVRLRKLAVEQGLKLSEYGLFRVDDDRRVAAASVHSNLNQSRDEMTRRLISAIEHPFVNVIGHPATRLIGKRRAVDFDDEAVFAAAARAGTALEINAFPDRLDLDDTLARRAREHGVKFAINTDAHAVPHLDYLRYGVATAQRAWIEREDVINTWPVERLRHFLAKGRLAS